MSTIRPHVPFACTARSGAEWGEAEGLWDGAAWWIRPLALAPEISADVTHPLPLAAAYSRFDRITHHERGSTYRVLATPVECRIWGEGRWWPGYCYEDERSGHRYARVQAAIENVSAYGPAV